MRVLFIEADEENELSTSVYLCRIPSAALNRTGKILSRVVHRNQFLKDPIERGWDIIVFERLLMAPFVEKIKEYQAMGTKVIARFDDNYALIPSYVSSHLLWRRNLLVRE